MRHNILLISDIHGNFPALKAVDNLLKDYTFTHILNCGDCLVYAPYPEETINWLRQRNVVSIRGNTDKKVRKLLMGKTFSKPHDPEKRIMYTSTDDMLQTDKNREYVCSLTDNETVILKGDDEKNITIGLFHGSPSDPKEFLFADTPDSRFAELAKDTTCDIIVTGHSHTPYVKYIEGKYYINPGSVGRMFDGDPRACCAILTVENNKIMIHHLRVAYDIDLVTSKITQLGLPEIYGEMFKAGRKLN